MDQSIATYRLNFTPEAMAQINEQKIPDTAFRGRIPMADSPKVGDLMVLIGTEGSIHLELVKRVFEFRGDDGTEIHLIFDRAYDVPGYSRLITDQHSP